MMSAFQAAQHAVGAPVAGEFDGGAHQMALVFFQLGLEAFVQGKGIGGGASEAGQHLVVVQLAHLARRALDHNVAQRHLPVAANGHLHPVGRLAPDTKNGGAVKLFHLEILACVKKRGQSLRSTTRANSVMPMT